MKILEFKKNPDILKYDLLMINEDDRVHSLCYN